MDWQVDCVAVIPCLNEEVMVGSLVHNVRKHVNAVLVIDDGSTDDTSRVASKAGATLIRHDINMGKGASLADAWRWSQVHGFKWALTLDGDGQHSSDDIPAFFSAARETSAALIVGNRMGDASNMPWVRRVVNRWMSRRISALAGQFLPDSQCGFRLMNLAAWARIPTTSTRFEIESEILLNFIAAGFLVTFVPIKVIYKNEKSKIHPLQDTVRWFRWWRRIAK